MSRPVCKHCFSNSILFCSDVFLPFSHIPPCFHAKTLFLWVIRVAGCLLGLTDSKLHVIYGTSGKTAYYATLAPPIYPLIRFLYCFYYVCQTLYIMYMWWDKLEIKFNSIQYFSKSFVPSLHEVISDNY